jgi:hypothetical protein
MVSASFGSILFRWRKTVDLVPHQLRDIETLVFEHQELRIEKYNEHHRT